MMREIKFRVFWTHPESDSSGFEYFKVGEKIPEPDPCKEYDVIEQYIGLKDKNGKEIYEGDIVIFLTSDPINNESYSEMTTYEEPIGWHYNHFFIKGTVYFQDCTFWLADTRWYTADELEVVGNIHE